MSCTKALHVDPPTVGLTKSTVTHLLVQQTHCEDRTYTQETGACTYKWYLGSGKGLRRQVGK